MCSFAVFLGLLIPRLSHVPSSKSGGDSHWEVLLSVYLYSCETRSLSNLTFPVLPQPPERWDHRCARPGRAELFLWLTVFSDLPYLPLESPVCLPLGVCSRLAGGRSCPACLQSCGWSPEQRGKGRKKRRFPQDFLTVSLAQFSLYSVISFLPKSISPGFYSLYLPFKM